MIESIYCALLGGWDIVNAQSILALTTVGRKLVFEPLSPSDAVLLT